MFDFNLIQGLPPYDFADKSEWSDDRLRSTAAKLLHFLERHVSAESAPEEVLFDMDQALENLAFEMKMRNRDMGRVVLSAAQEK